MGEVEKLLKNKVFRVHDSITELLPSVNGVINEKLMTNAVLSSLYRAVRSLESFVKIKHNYPEKEYSKVEIETDLIVMHTKDYEILLNHVKNLEAINKVNGNTYE